MLAIQLRPKQRVVVSQEPVLTKADVMKATTRPGNPVRVGCGHDLPELRGFGMWFVTVPKVGQSVKVVHLCEESRVRVIEQAKQNNEKQLTVTLSQILNDRPPVGWFKDTTEVGFPNIKRAWKGLVHVEPIELRRKKGTTARTTRRNWPGDLQPMSQVRLPLRLSDEKRKREEGIKREREEGREGSRYGRDERSVHSEL